jgi:hypothetical protein
VSGWVRGVLAAIAVFAGLSPLLWVTANEYRTLAEEDEIQRDREALLRRAKALVESGELEDLGTLVQETRERYPDDESLARELSMILLQGAHSGGFRKPGASK